MKKVLVVIIVVVALMDIAVAQSPGVKKRRPLPHEYGRVVINNYSEKAHIAPVVFDHWLHRSNFTCRLCHVDLGFAMKANTTKIQAADNARGYYCGTCHNGKMKFGDRVVFESCPQDSKLRDMRKCERCHSHGVNVKKEYDFYAFTKDLPKERFGNGINWEKAENQGLIKLIGFLKGVSIERPPLKVQKDFSLDAKIEGMANIIFSHKKHTVWNGCEVCHPEIFTGVKKGLTKYSMPDIYEGKYCGVCHGSVAFPLLDCQRCHTEQVQ